MNGIARNALRLRSLLGPAATLGGARSTRALWSRQSGLVPATSSATSLAGRHRHPCACVSCRFNHSKAEKELGEFLAEEIVVEKKALQHKTIPTELEGFKVSLNGADVTLTKTAGNEQIKISFNVNHTVDTEDEPELDPRNEQQDIAEMKSKPTFEIDIKRNNQTLAFTCSFNDQPGASGSNEEFNDIFGIDEISLYEGEYTDKVYSVAGEIIDGYLYDLLMNYLEEKGISNEFAEKLSELSTSYEHTAYVGLLEGLSKFTSQ